ncbi:MAG: glucose-6-phosphate dehydrogenase [Candidatus Portnoybacteria bacterium]|nr:glucose-6-phosphate dehydrogenase [Candidatus Portnoybacteria bacterium]
MDIKPSNQLPTVFVVFGATGDLMTKKIVPALFHLFAKGKLPSLFQVIGVARRDLSEDAFREHIQSVLTSHQDAAASQNTHASFLSLFSYHQGVFEDRASYERLAKKLGQIDGEWRVCSNKLFYLAVPPNLYETIFRRLHSSGLTTPCSPEEGWTRVIVEKPVGESLQTSQKIEELLAKLFKEVQIYRIEHYLAKEMIQNILSFRFSNSIFEESWSNRFIERIDIRLLEAIGVEKRGVFYEGVGALRDVGQNHLLQMLALVAMEHPLAFESEKIRQKRAKILTLLQTPSTKEIKNFTFRAQYKGYRQIEGVDPLSQTETYFKIRTFLSSPRWQGVPFILESGKRLGEARKEVVVTFKHPTPCLCPLSTETGGKEHYKDKVIFSLEPKEGITIQFWSKKPGFEFLGEERSIDFLLRKKRASAQYVEEYAKLLLDCITGDQTLFVSTEEVGAMWRFIDPIVEAWQKNLVPLKFYPPDTAEPSTQSRFIDESLEALPRKKLTKEIGIIGLGKMGANLARRLMEKGWRVAGYNITPEATKQLEQEGIAGAYSLHELVECLSPPRIIWLMVPAGKPVDEVIFGKEGLVNFLEKGDTIVDGGNSFYTDTISRYKKVKKEGLDFIDVGVSGGPGGARNGACLMIGGSKKIYERLEPLFADIARENGYQFFEGEGAGHFVKMVHNGIEYGMMQSLAEGFALLKKSPYKLDLTRVADLYNHGSVVESRLVEWLKGVLEAYGQELKEVSGKVEQSGEGLWTVKEAKALGVDVASIELAVNFRTKSQKKPSYTGKLLSGMRNQFGGHRVA